MPAKPMTERFVQDAVAERLNRDYYRRRPAYIATEAYTKLKRADVFLAFMRARKRPYVVVVEAKSRTTIHQLKLKDHRGRIRWAGRIVTLILLAILSATLGYQWYFNAVNTILLITLFLFGSAVISGIARWLELSTLQSVGVIEQLGRYPANEQWIAIGEDTFLKPAEYRALLRQCRKNRIGLIVVTPSGKLQLKAEPAPKHTFNIYLDQYGKEADILRAIDKNPDYGPTPPERKKRRRQLFNIFLMLGGLGVLLLTVYDENVAPIVPDPFAEGAFADEPITGELPDPSVDEPGERVACGELAVEHRSFMLIEGVYGIDKAEKRLALLAARGFLEARALPTECLNSSLAPGNRVIWLGEVYPDRPSARAAENVLRERLAAGGLKNGRVRVLKIRPSR